MRPRSTDQATSPSFSRSPFESPLRDAPKALFRLVSFLPEVVKARNEYQQDYCVIGEGWVRRALVASWRSRSVPVRYLMYQHDGGRAPSSCDVVYALAGTGAFLHPSIWYRLFFQLPQEKTAVSVLVSDMGPPGGGTHRPALFSFVLVCFRDNVSVNFSWVHVRIRSLVATEVLVQHRSTTGIHD